VMPSPDTLATIAAVVFMALLILSMRLVRPTGQQPRHGAAWLDAHEVPAAARYGPYNVERFVIAPARPLSALETAPDPVSPFAARTA
jgi:hypothetical protein